MNFLPHVPRLLSGIGDSQYMSLRMIGFTFGEYRDKSAHGRTFSRRAAEMLGILKVKNALVTNTPLAIFSPLHTMLLGV